MRAKPTFSPLLLALLLVAGAAGLIAGMVAPLPAAAESPLPAPQTSPAPQEASRALGVATSPGPQSALATSPSAYRRCFAVLVGVNRYRALSEENQLSFAVADALALRDLLVGEYGYRAEDVRVLTDQTDPPPTKRAILDALYDLSDTSRVEPGDSVLFYFAGHGKDIGAGERKEGFLLPCDAEVDLAQLDNPAQFNRTCISMDELVRVARMIPARHKLFLMDSCYSGLMLKRRDATERPIGPGYVSRLLALDALQFMTAGTAAQQVVERGDLGHSAYAFKLLEALRQGGIDRDGDNVILASELASYVKKQIPNLRVDQTPQYAEDGPGDFMFFRSAGRRNDSREENGTQETGPQQVAAGQDGVSSPVATAPSQFDSMLTQEETRKDRSEKARQAFDRLGSVSSRGGIASIEEAKRLADLWDGYIREYGEPVGYRLAEAQKKRDWFRTWHPPTPTPRPAPTPVPPTPTPKPPEPESGRVEKADLGGGVALEMVWVPSGSFTIGSPDSEEGRDDDEEPQTRVEIEGFWMGKYEVTNAQYRAFLSDSKYNGSPESDSDYLKHFRVSGDMPTGDDYPVVWVSWKNAMAFCSWLSRRAGKGFTLPSEGQWEYACRAGSEGRFCFGDSAESLGDYAWYSANSNGKTHPVGRKRPNAFGLFDMHGNACEWCLSNYKYYPYRETDGRNATFNMDAHRMLRGGSWRYSVSFCRSADRVQFFPRPATGLNGFRVVGVGRTLK